MSEQPKDAERHPKQPEHFHSPAEWDAYLEGLNGRPLHMYAWSRPVRFIAVAQASSVAEARELILEEIESSHDGSCPEREAADKFVREFQPTIWHGPNAEFTLTDSAEARENEAYAEKLRTRLQALETELRALAKRWKAYSPSDPFKQRANCGCELLALLDRREK